MSTPAGRPWRVITISSSAANRKNLDRSSFTSARATSLGWAVDRRPFFVEPRLGLGFRDDREDFNLRFCNIIKHSNIIDAEPILRLAQPAKALDAALAHLHGFVPQVPFESVFHSCADRRRQALQRCGRLRRQDDLVPHSGQIIARRQLGRVSASGS